MRPPRSGSGSACNAGSRSPSRRGPARAARPAPETLQASERATAIQASFALRSELRPASSTSLRSACRSAATAAFSSPPRSDALQSPCGAAVGRVGLDPRGTGNAVGFHTARCSARRRGVAIAVARACAEPALDAAPAAPSPLDPTDSGLRPYLSHARRPCARTAPTGRRAVRRRQGAGAAAGEPRAAAASRRAAAAARRGRGRRRSARAGARDPRALRRGRATRKRARRSVADFDDGRRDDALAAAHARRGRRRSGVAAGAADPRASALPQRRRHGALGAPPSAPSSWRRTPAQRCACARARESPSPTSTVARPTRAQLLRMHRDDPEARAILADACCDRPTPGPRSSAGAVPRGRRNAACRRRSAGSHSSRGSRRGAHGARGSGVRAPDTSWRSGRTSHSTSAKDARTSRVRDSAAAAARPDDAALRACTRRRSAPRDATTKRARASRARSRSIRTRSPPIARSSSGCARAPERRDRAARGSWDSARARRCSRSACCAKARDGSQRRPLRTSRRRSRPIRTLAVARARSPSRLRRRASNSTWRLTLAREARAARPRDPEIADTLGLVASASRPGLVRRSKCSAKRPAPIPSGGPATRRCSTTAAWRSRRCARPRARGDTADIALALADQQARRRRLDVASARAVPRAGGRNPRAGRRRRDRSRPQRPPHAAGTAEARPRRAAPAPANAVAACSGDASARIAATTLERRQRSEATLAGTSPRQHARALHGWECG